MLAYSRCKSIGVQLQGQERRVVTGVLEDELYAMECEILVHWPTLTIEAVSTKMKRYTTYRCPEAARVFSKAEGWIIGPGLNSRIKKELGRNGCRHMAVLMVDCCQALVRAEYARELRATIAATPECDAKKSVESFLDRNPGLRGYLLIR